MLMKKPVVFFSFIAVLLMSFCRTSAQISRSAVNDFLNDSAVSTGHAGISIYDPAAGKYLFNYNADKNFMPSSNVKLFTLYAGMKYLGDSIIGLRYQRIHDSLKIFAAGDPAFLHPDFKSQPVYDFLKNEKNILFCSQLFFAARGPGWAWDDYLEDFMAERSEFPIYGNLIRISVTDDSIYVIPKTISLNAHNFSNKKNTAIEWNFYRNWNGNDLSGSPGSMHPKTQQYQIPLSTDNYDFPDFLADTIHTPVTVVTNMAADSIDFNDKRLAVIRSRPVDSLFRPMMYNSDNFFAEQTLLMVSNEHLGYMDDEAIIDSLLRNDYKDIPTKPRWVDGSGLSRYNLFSPEDFVYILNKLRNDFGWERIKNMLPSSGKGTLKGYYENIAGKIYAKTGSMSNNVSLSGYLISAKGRTLIFSVIINNFSGSGTSGRRAIEKLLLRVQESN